MDGHDRATYGVACPQLKLSKSRDKEGNTNSHAARDIYSAILKFCDSAINAGAEQPGQCI